MDEWIKKIANTQSTQTGILFSLKKEWFLPSATTWTDLEGTMQSEISQTRKTNTLCLNGIYTYMWNLQKQNKTCATRGNRLAGSGGQR